MSTPAEFAERYRTAYNRLGNAAALTKNTILRKARSNDPGMIPLVRATTTIMERAAAELVAACGAKGEEAK
jgi:hypothetical protein